MSHFWIPRQTRTVLRSSEAEVDVEATRSLHASAEAFLESAGAIIERMQTGSQSGVDDPGQYLRAAAHFVLGTAYELTLKLMLRQSEVAPPGHHRLVGLYDSMPNNAMRAILDDAYQQGTTSVSYQEATIVITKVVANKSEIGSDPPNPDLTTVRDWLHFMDKDVRHHLQRFAWEDRRCKRATQHLADLSPFCEILKVTLENVGVPPEPTTPHHVYMGIEDRQVSLTDDFTLSKSVDPGQG